MIDFFKNNNGKIAVVTVTTIAICVSVLFFSGPSVLNNPYNAWPVVSKTAFITLGVNLLPFIFSFRKVWKDSER